MEPAGGQKMKFDAPSEKLPCPKTCQGELDEILSNFTVGIFPRCTCEGCWGSDGSESDALEFFLSRRPSAQPSRPKEAPDLTLSIPGTSFLQALPGASLKRHSELLDPSSGIWSARRTFLRPTPPFRCRPAVLTSPLPTPRPHPKL